MLWFVFRRACASRTVDAFPLDMSGKAVARPGLSADRACGALGERHVRRAAWGQGCPRGSEARDFYGDQEEDFIFWKEYPPIWQGAGMSGRCGDGGEARRAGHPLMRREGISGTAWRGAGCASADRQGLTGALCPGHRLPGRLRAARHGAGRHGPSGARRDSAGRPCGAGFV